MSIVSIAILGFVIAQTAPNPGHLASDIQIGGSINNRLEIWANNINDRVNNIENVVVPNLLAGINSLQTQITGVNGLSDRINNLESARWTGLQPYNIDPPYYRSILSGTTSHVIPSSIPGSAKSVLVYVNTENPTSNGEITLYTKATLTNYVQKMKYSLGSANSDNIWFPVTPDRTIYVDTSGLVDPGSRIQIIGYR